MTGDHSCLVMLLVFKLTFFYQHPKNAGNSTPNNGANKNCKQIILRKQQQFN